MSEQLAPGGKAIVERRGILVMRREAIVDRPNLDAQFHRAKPGEHLAHLAAAGREAAAVDVEIYRPAKSDRAAAGNRVINRKTAFQLDNGEPALEPASAWAQHLQRRFGGRALICGRCLRTHRGEPFCGIGEEGLRLRAD